MSEGIVTKAVNSFFTVQTDEGNRVCRARGVFRKRGIQVLVGDNVLINPIGQSEGVITEVLPRTTELIRPPIANVDQSYLVCSLAQPNFQQGLLDRMLVAVMAAKLAPIIVMNKADLVSQSEIDHLIQPYQQAGYQVHVVSVKQEQGLTALWSTLPGKISVFVGASGVGKSSLVNTISPQLAQTMGEISEKLGRGKHTTRHVELFALGDKTYAADAPGFSQLDVPVMPEEVRHYFWEFSTPAEACPYRGCLHSDEQECGVKQSVQAGVISTTRYESYLSILQECQTREDRRY